MNFLKKTALFSAGGLGYVGLEFLWRGHSHYSMFLAGGSCFLLLGGITRAKPRLKLPFRAALGATVVTAVELLTGLLVNRQYTVWDYRNQPLNFHGQICPVFSLLWMPVSLIAMELYALADKGLDKTRFR